METEAPMRHVTSVQVVEGDSRSRHLRGKAYLLHLECGHQMRRTYSRGLPKTMNVRCAQCVAVVEAEETLSEDPAPVTGGGFGGSILLLGWVFFGFYAVVTLFKGSVGNAVWLGVFAFVLFHFWKRS